MASCSADISSEKNPTARGFCPCWIDSRSSSAIFVAALWAMVVASAVFPIAGPAGEDDEVRRMQPAEQPVHVGEAGGEAHDVLGMLVGALGALQRDLQRVFQRLEAALRVAVDGEVEQLLLGHFDLRRAAVLGDGVVRRVHHLLADADQLPLGRMVADDARVVVRVDDRGRRPDEPREILVLDALGAGEMVLERDRLAISPLSWNCRMARNSRWCSTA